VKAAEASTKAQATNQSQASRPTTQTADARAAAESKRIEKNIRAEHGKVDMNSGVQKMLRDVEHGQNQMELIMREAMSGRKFNPQELLALQAGVYRYAQELELASKVVEKATTGVKDTLKTQV
jgi:hypothetical protein